MRKRTGILLAAMTLIAASGGLSTTTGRVQAQARPQAQPQAQPQPQPQPVQVEPQERSPFAGLECLTKAQRVLYLVDQTAYSLCVGAGSDAPMQCFAAGRASTNLTDPQLVALCRCSTTTAPVQCFMMASKQAYLLDDALIGLCSAVVTQQLFPGDCSARRY